MKTREVKLGEVANVKGGKRIPKGIGLINIPMDIRIFGYET